jgi:ADP-ribosyl-[dinitrogen reductase] hydrolase
MNMPANHKAILGSLLGTAVGDALGLPYEGISKRRAKHLWGEPDRMRFFFGRGMVSDDTEHTCIVAQALIESGGQLPAFTKSMARRLRWWLVSIPAGIGRATLRATMKLWLGFSPTRSGVFSAGNGPAMRSAILGAALDDLDQLCTLTRASTFITHTDPKAENGALAVALAARLARSQPTATGDVFLKQIRSVVAKEKAREFLTLMEKAVSSAERGESTTEFAAVQGMGQFVSGYVYHTVPVAIHAWLRYGSDFRQGIIEVIRCGGDADTTAAIAGGIIGSGVGKEGIPTEWLNRLADWPRTKRWMEQLADQLFKVLQTGQAERALRLPVLGLLTRNAFFFILVLVHVFRRCLPPY